MPYPARPREPRPELVAAIARRNEIRALRTELARISRGPATPERAKRTDPLLERLRELTGKETP